MDRSRAYLVRDLDPSPALIQRFDAAARAYRDALAARSPAPDTADSAASLDQGARSQAERLLFAALESHPDTRGRFALNQRLDIRFGSAPMEVDLLCAEWRVVVEVDGYYHFRDQDAYRRDRRKDVLLQLHDHLVLRCLADDVMTNLEHVLRTIRRALAAQRTRVATTAARARDPREP